MIETGNLCVLNVGAGDIKLVFNNQDKHEAAKAIRMLEQMLERGYLIAVELSDGSYTRAERIDASRGRYVITLPEDAQAPPDAEPEPRKRRGRPPKVHGKAGKRVSVPIQTSRATGVARSAGG